MDIRPPITTAPRPLVDNLDRFPFPERTNKRKNTILGRVATSLIASRGCARTSSTPGRRPTLGAPMRRCKASPVRRSSPISRPNAWTSLTGTLCGS